MSVIKKEKIIAMIMIIITIIVCTTISYGFGIKDLKGNQVEVNTLKDAGNNVTKVVTTIGVVISVIVLIVLGIKYMFGSVEEKAEYKKTLLPYFIGAALVFAASSIAQIIYDLAIKL
jgi:hypothetical protein